MTARNHVAGPDQLALPRQEGKKALEVREVAVAVAEHGVGPERPPDGVASNRGDRNGQLRR